MLAPEDLEQIKLTIRRETQAAAAEWMSRQDAEIYAGKGRRNLENLIKNHGLQLHRNGGKLLFSKREIDRVISSI
ncbi:hypothetical protein [Lacticaseibacillus brantae]|uniref:Helix-turn-helix domain-containing protein n=1 Tax=Lacticaseibacillus brantae DSM 23927 TaxID=1423727 RepID=A0A0R2B1C8_9LACO|nr:hypothetical protein [Lacticaseibacillus brantae]KRM73039.1 hypothetical protein FC34_GL000760 [Lacticaseibacillus brantae DSM 23927]